ncbi:MAG: CAP domain-containing protein [Anaerolineae bacterium]
MRYRLLVPIVLLVIIGAIIPTTQAQGATQDLLGRINNLRAERGLPPYTLNSALSAAAANHAQWMANTAQVSHVQDNGSSPRSRAQANGYNSQWVSENIYMGRSIDTAWNFWINSSIHYAGLTSPNYRDIGIASAQGTGGQAFVLVFGVPPGASTVTNNRTSSSGDDSASNAPPPLPIVGYDAVGNIQYELQAGDTLGQVLLLFGYTWDDLGMMLALNELSDADIRSLDVGQVLLVPPPQGTYTPTPIAEAVTAEVTDAPEITEAPISDESQPVPEVTEVVSEAPGEDTPAPETTDTPAPTETPTVTATASPVPTLRINTQSEPVTQVAQGVTPLSEEARPPRTEQSRSGQQPPLWLIGAIAVQLGVLGIASVEYLRRMRR